jgi:hypothetical protein
MPAIVCLLFITVPIIAALSLELDGFVTLLFLFCVAAGLSTNSASLLSNDATRDRGDGARYERGDSRTKSAQARGEDGGRALEFSRF